MDPPDHFFLKKMDPWSTFFPVHFLHDSLYSQMASLTLSAHAQRVTVLSQDVCVSVCLLHLPRSQYALRGSSFSLNDV